MTESAMNKQVLVRRTLVTAGTMLGGCVLIVGTLTLVALAIVGHSATQAESDATGDAGAATALTAHGRPGGFPNVPTTAKTK